MRASRTRSNAAASIALGLREHLLDTERASAANDFRHGVQVRDDFDGRR
jgi:hypothetical protein